MEKILNFINPDKKLINRINIYNIISSTPFNYVISEFPQISADIIFVPVSELKCITLYRELQYIPFIVYGSPLLLEKSFIMGASDFLKDPWSFEELEIRAKRHINNDHLDFHWGIISFSNFFIKNEKQSLPFSVYEYKILSMMLSNTDKIVSRENIHYRLGIKNCNSRVVDVYINSIRKKISLLNYNKCSLNSVITTVRGKGYTINSHYSCG